MATIDLSNYNTLLVQSSVGRSGIPDGNIFFDVANGRIEIITVEEQATINMTSRGGGATDPNPLSQQDGIKLEALYAFEREQRRLDETLRRYDYFFKGTFKFGGAYELVNGRKFDDANGSNTSLTVDDRYKIRSSGWIERNAAGAIGRIYYGVRSLGNIEASSAPFYQLSAGGPVTDFDKVGPVDEAIQVYGDNAIDSTTTTFDNRTYMAMSVRTYGFNYDQKILADSGIVEMGGYASGFALTESEHLTTNTTDHPLASVYNVNPALQTGVWANMTLEELDVPQVETGFNEVDGSFSWVLNNPGGASLSQCVAYLDAISRVDADINAHATNTTFGKRVPTWYTYNAAGKILPRTNIVNKGLFIEGLLGADKTAVVFTDDNGNAKTYPNYLSVSVNIGAEAVADPLSWFHAFFLNGPGAGDDFNTSGALVVQDASGNPVKGNVSAHAYLSGNSLIWEFDHAGDTIGGTAGTDKSIVFECEGDGGVTAAKTIFILTDPDINSSINASCVPPVETNI